MQGKAKYSYLGMKRPDRWLPLHCDKVVAAYLGTGPAKQYLPTYPHRGSNSNNKPTFDSHHPFPPCRLSTVELPLGGGGMPAVFVDCVAGGGRTLTVSWTSADVLTHHIQLHLSPSSAGRRKGTSGSNWQHPLQFVHTTTCACAATCRGYLLKHPPPLLVITGTKLDPEHHCSLTCVRRRLSVRESAGYCICPAVEPRVE
ncbi:hypothetical protein LX36DRAFT_357683 [Colletotrichum falcatum]|nr:hypothetical protein LX36DRAFT_357683 [Colletotrichum falcatum]